jgi:hypothetical protein
MTCELWTVTLELELPHTVPNIPCGEEYPVNPVNWLLFMYICIVRGVIPPMSLNNKPPVEYEINELNELSNIVSVAEPKRFTSGMFVEGFEEKVILATTTPDKYILPPPDPVITDLLHEPCVSFVIVQSIMVIIPIPDNIRNAPVVD